MIKILSKTLFLTKTTKSLFWPYFAAMKLYGKKIKMAYFGNLEAVFLRFLAIFKIHYKI